MVFIWEQILFLLLSPSSEFFTKVLPISGNWNGLIFIQLSLLNYR